MSVSAKNDERVSMRQLRRDVFRHILKKENDKPQVSTIGEDEDSDTN